MAFPPVEFLNRETELGACARVIHEHASGLILVHGSQGMGKTWFMDRLLAQFRAAGINAASINGADQSLLQPNRVIRHLRERINGAFADHMDKAEAQIMTDFLGLRTVASDGVALRHTGTVDERATNPVVLTGSVNIGGDFVSRDKITISNSIIALQPGQGEALLAEEAELRRNAAFRSALLEYLATNRVAIMFDHYETMTDTVSAWITQTLLTPLLEDANRYSGLWLVIAGEKTPMEDQTDRWPDLALSITIGSLPKDAVIPFWVNKRGADPNHVDLALRASAGNTNLLNIFLKNLTIMPAAGI